MPRAPLPARTQPPTEPRLWLPLAIALAFAGCQDATGPLSERNVARSQVGVAGQLVSDAMASTQLSILQQAPTAPPLETYQLSFWAYKGDPSTVTVNYQPAAGEWVGQPFLELSIPKNGLDRKSTRLNSSHGYISYAVFCLKKKKKHKRQ